MSREGWRPEQRVVVPGHPGVKVEYIGNRTCERTGCELDWIIYIGTAEALTAAGVATPEMLTVAPGRGLGRRGIGKNGRTDPEGFRFHKDWWWCRAGTGEAYRVFKLRRWLPLKLLYRLPGTIEALAAFDAGRAWDAAQAAAHEAESAARHIEDWKEVLRPPGGSYLH